MLLKHIAGFIIVFCSLVSVCILLMFSSRTDYTDSISEVNVFGKLFTFCLGMQSGSGLFCKWNRDCIQKFSSESHFQDCIDLLQTPRFFFSKQALTDLVLNSVCQTKKPKKALWLCINVYRQPLDVALNVVYHLLAGVEHILVFDEGSNDGTEQILQPFVDLGVVTWLLTPGRQSQLSSYQRGLEIARKNKVEWIMFQDADEFFFDTRGCCIFERFWTAPRNVSVISTNWLMMFPSLTPSWRNSRDITYFSMTKFPSFGALHAGVKSACRPAYASMTSVHFCTPERGFLQVNNYQHPFRGHSSYELKRENLTSVILHFHFNGDLIGYVAKRSRGTGDIIRDSDGLPVESFVDAFAQSAGNVGDLRIELAGLSVYLEKVHNIFLSSTVATKSGAQKTYKLRKRFSASRSPAKDCQQAKQDYLSKHKDVYAAGVDPWTHFIRHGQAEGRSWRGVRCDDTTSIVRP